MTGKLAAPARILIVEDEESIRLSVEEALRRVGYEVRAEADGRRIRQVTEDFRPDVAILDIRLPVGPDGYAIARVLQEERDVPFLFLTAADDVEDRVAGLQAGADDYVVKPFAQSELLARTEAVLRRSSRPPSTRSFRRKVGELVFDSAAGTAERAGTRLDLTPTEFRLLETLVEHRGQVLSKHQLLTRVWGPDCFDTNLVEVHLSALRRKVEAVGSRTRLIHTVLRAGYVLRP